MNPVPLLLALLASTPANTSDTMFTGFDDFAARYRAAAPAARDALAASFVAWQRSRGGFPVIERDGAVLIWLGTGREQSVAVGGDFKPRHRFTVYWDERGEPMERVAEGGRSGSGACPSRPTRASTTRSASTGAGSWIR